MKRLASRLVRKRLFYLMCIAVLIGVGIALWPSARCAIAQEDCNDREKWCSEDCDKACAGATGFGYVNGCSFDYSSGSCVPSWFPDRINGTCSNPDNCNVVDVDMFPERLLYIGGVSYWNVGKCTHNPSRWDSCLLEYRSREVTCCVGAGEEPPEECQPSYNAPVIDTGDLALTPPYPLVLGQDPDRMGISMSGITATGGADTECDFGSAKITDLKATIALSEESITWITEDLSSRYYNANVIGAYPAEPTSYEVVGLGTTNATITFRFDNPDPGWYNITVTATQGDGKIAQTVIRVRTAMLDTTGTMP